MTSTTGVVISSSALRRLALLGATFSATAPAPVSSTSTSTAPLADPAAAVLHPPSGKRVRHEDVIFRVTRDDDTVRLQIGSASSSTPRRPKERSPTSKRQLSHRHGGKQAHAHCHSRARTSMAPSSSVRLHSLQLGGPNIETRRSLSIMSLFKPSASTHAAERTLTSAQDTNTLIAPTLLQSNLAVPGTRGLSTAESSYDSQADTKVRQRSHSNQQQRTWEPSISRPEVQLDQINTLLRHPALFTEVFKPRLPIVLCHGQFARCHLLG